MMNEVTEVQIYDKGNYKDDIGYKKTILLVHGSTCRLQGKT